MTQSNDPTALRAAQKKTAVRSALMLAVLAVGIYAWAILSRI